MRVISGRNVHQILPTALRLIRLGGVQRPSRNGEVLQLHEPVTTVYDRPWERVLLWPTRDANPFFHLYESFWMLDGRNDLASLTRYVKSFGQFSDDGRTLRGAYGHRWRWFFGVDQLAVVVEALKKDKNDRRCVVQMWDTDRDLGKVKKDLPCNLIMTFQVSTAGELELTVFCRSNDIVWGAYGANAVHFSMLHEYMATAIDVPMGRMRQVSVNWHAYTKTLEPVAVLEQIAFGDYGDDLSAPLLEPSPYDGKVQNIRMRQHPQATLDAWIKWLLNDINGLYVDEALSGQRLPPPKDMMNDNFWFVVHGVLEAHWIFKSRGVLKAMEHLDTRFSNAMKNVDWVVAAREWLDRRLVRKVG